VAALTDRKEIRDAFDIEFLLRKGINLPSLSEDKKEQLSNKLDQFTSIDYKVKLGSIIEGELRDYYVRNRFSFLQSVIKNN
jgi:hypothetical protein